MIATIKLGTFCTYGSYTVYFVPGKTAELWRENVCDKKRRKTDDNGSRLAWAENKNTQSDRYSNDFLTSSDTLLDNKLLRSINFIRRELLQNTKTQCSFFLDAGG